MNTFLKYAYLFFIGSLLGWWMELFFRRATNPQHKWVNPGFCTGPYLPIYGFGLCLLYFIASLEPRIAGGHPILSKIGLFFAMAVGMTAVEYIGGVLSLKHFHVRLWDYSDQWGNIDGIICPLFSLIWAALGGLYYLLVHPFILGALDWLSRNLAFSFVIGLFFGVFIIDVCHALQLMNRLKAYADKNELVLRWEAIKTNIRADHDRRAQKYHFFHPFRSDRPLSEHLREMQDSFERRVKKLERK